MKKFYDPEAEYIEIDALISTGMDTSGTAGDIGGGSQGDEDMSDFLGGNGGN